MMHWTLQRCGISISCEWPKNMSDIKNKIIRHKLVLGFLGIIALFVLFGLLSLRVDGFIRLAEKSHQRIEVLSILLMLVGILLSSVIAFFTVKHVLKNEAELERQIAERTVELSEANQKLQHEIKERMQAYEKQNQRQNECFFHILIIK